MQKKLGILGVCLLVAGCGPLALTPSAPAIDGGSQVRPQSRPDILDNALRPPSDTARTAEEFDTTTADERRVAASATPVSAERALGATIVSLGDPTRPGFWLETSLVSSPSSGRVVYPATGQSAQVELIPSDGGGGRMSLPAMRLIGVPLTGLVEVQVFSGG
ncbi:MAG: hypothetical protein ACSHXH_07180 [Marivita sp.]|uniref:hypothetical protein n=1 Tax=Marivita sp. TaxID=2003365 RepID=UPI003EF6C28E